MTVRNQNRRQDRNESYFQRLISSVERTDLERGDGTALSSRNDGIQATRSRPERITFLESVRNSTMGYSTAISLFHLRGISYPKLDEELSSIVNMMTEVCTGLHGQNIRIVFILSGDSSGINLWLGSIGENNNADKAAQICQLSAQSLESILTGFFPNIDMELAKANLPSVVDLEKLMHDSKYYGFVTGIPSQKPSEKRKRPEQLEKLIRGLYRQRYVIMVLTEPVKESVTCNAFNTVLEEIKEQYGYIKTSTQRQQTSAISVSAEQVNRYAQHYVSQLELGIKRLDEGKSIGMWRTGVYFFSPESSAYNKLKALIRSTFGGRQSRPQPIRSVTFSKANIVKMYIDAFQQLNAEMNDAQVSTLAKFNRFRYLTMLNSREVATLIRPLAKEFPGFSVSALPDYGLAVCRKPSAGHISLGEVRDGRIATGNNLQIKTDDLSRHVLITGVTGSGKTNTCMEMLNQLWSRFGIPFLVIEPAKSEYRELFNIKAMRSELQIFTLGDERTAPFRINPFEITPGTLVQTHLDHLKSVFNASFVMYSPMPYVLEQCMHEIYEDKGWDLLTGENRHDSAELKNKGTLFPTLTDLYRKIDDVVSRLGYEQRISMDVRAGLKTRLNSLRIGGKGTMLDCLTSTPISLILFKPTILELKRIGDDEEKAFLIGLLLMKIYEHLEASTQRKAFGHLTLIEEAHRLLANVPTDTGNLELANTKGKALETFCNILSEIRAYGEGVMIAEQIPVKLAPDVIKNTNLKLLHRVVSLDDREAVGFTMNLDEFQIKHISTIDRGMAAAFAEGMDKPVMIYVPSFKDEHFDSSVVLDDAKVKKLMSDCYRENPKILGQYYGCRYCKSRCSYLHLAKRIADQVYYRRKFYSFVQKLLLSPGIIAEAHPSIVRMVERAMKRKKDKIEQKLKGNVLCAGIQMAQYYFYLRRDQHGYSYASMEQFCNHLIDIFARMTEMYLEKKLGEISKLIAKDISTFRQEYIKALETKLGPFEGCRICKSKCVWRYEMEPLVYAKKWGSKFDDALESEDKSKSLRVVCYEAAKDVVPELPELKLQPLAICYFTQQIALSGLKNQIEIVKKVFPNA